MTNNYLMSLQCFCAAGEVLVNQPQLSEKQQSKQMKIAIDKVIEKYKS